MPKKNRFTEIAKNTTARMTGEGDGPRCGTGLRLGNMAFRCQLPRGHSGVHRDEFDSHPLKCVVVTWTDAEATDDE
jgi:hypothetical protein